MTSFEQFQDAAARGNVVPVVDSLPADLFTPLSVYLKLSANGVRSFLLESVEGGENLGRFSFIGAGPHTYAAGNKSSTIIETRIGQKSINQAFWEYVKGHFSGITVAADEDLPSFAGGAIGYFGFSCSGWFEPTILQDSKDATEAELMIFRSIVAFDHVKQQIKIVTLVFLEEIGGDPIIEAYARAAEANLEIRKLLENGPLAIPPGRGPDESSQVASNWDRKEFESAVIEIKDQIAAGECYQVVLSQCFSKRTSASAVSIYRALRSLNPSPYMFLLQFHDKAVIGASPEMLVRSRGTNLEYRPIAGTRPRGSDNAEDERLAQEMRNDSKEIAEHQMLVDLGRNDLGRVAKYGSVMVSRFMNVEKYSHVQHLVSYLTAELRDDCDRFDAFAACFPAGTVSGAPKVRAIETILRLEPTDRGVYAGAVGYFDYAGNMDTCIAIRTLVLTDAEVRIQAGAGIVADSIPESEFDESVNKAKALLRAVEIAEEG